MAKVVRKDKILSGYNGNLKSFKIHNGAGEVKSHNGVFVVSEGLLANEREVEKGRLAGVSDVAEEVYLIHNGEVMYDERLHKIEDYVIEAGKASRGYSLSNGDVITLTVDLFVAEPAVGDELVVHTNGLLGEDAVALDTAKIKFKVIEDSGYELHRNTKAYAVEVVR